jgi:hypothetical protein
MVMAWTLEGLFELRTVGDLLKKLEFDYDRMCGSPVDTYIAFDFFVTAEHMLDWQYPGDANKGKRNQERKSYVLLQMCSHIADGFKHFKVENTHHKSVTSSQVESGVFDPNVFQNDAFDVGRLVVELDGDAAANYGSHIEVTDLAAKILNFWKRHTSP